MQKRLTDMYKKQAQQIECEFVEVCEAHDAMIDRLYEEKELQLKIKVSARTKELENKLFAEQTKNEQLLAQLAAAQKQLDVRIYHHINFFIKKHILCYLY